MKKLLLLILLSPLSLFATNYYISTTGNNTNNGLSSATAKATLANVFSSYNLGAGDIIYVGAGTYAEKNITIGSDDEGFTIQGSELDASGQPTTIFDSDQTTLWLKFGNDNNDNITIDKIKVKDYKSNLNLPNGGGICVNGYDCAGITISDCCFDNCDAGNSGKGGAIFFFKLIGTTNTINLLNNTFTNCNADAGGGAVYISSSSEIDLNVSKCKFFNNSSSVASGSALYYDGPSSSVLTMTNCLVYKNTLSGNNHGTIYIGPAACIANLMNCTIADNTAQSSYTGGVYFEAGGSTLTNCIIYNNTYKDVYRSAGTINLKYCCYKTHLGCSPSNSFTTDPGFKSPSINDYSLATTSSCIDKATATGAPSDDILSAPRPMGLGYDIGAYEYSSCSVNSASSTPTVCINSPITNITHTTTGATGIGAATGLPTGLTATFTGNATAGTITISGTPSIDGIFNYSIPLIGGCGNVIASGKITVNSNMLVGIASSNPTICISTTLTDITFTTSGATGIGTATGLPAGVSAKWSSNTITISGTPTESGDFNFNIPLIGGCGFVQAIGNITVSQSIANTNTATVASNSPKICTGSLNSIDISHTTTGATGISTLISNFGLPQGITASWSNNEIKILGSTTEKGVFNYTIPLTGGCGNINAIGTINVVEYPTITTFPEGYPNLSVCENTPMFKDIVFNTQGVIGLSNDVLNNNYGLPKGLKVNFSGNSTSGELKISGTPHEGFSSNGLPPYQVNIVLKSECEFVADVKMQISVSSAPIAMEINSNINACLNSPVNIETHFVNGMFDISSSPILPQGLKVEKTNGNQIILSGVPEEIGTFDYYISLIDAYSSSFSGCRMGGLAHGKITVSSLNTVSLNSNSITVCNNTLLTPIIHNTTGATGIGLATGLPAGVTASWLSNTLTISGSPSVSGTFNYSIPLIGGCGSLNATGTIIVTTSTSASPISGNTDICQGSTSQLTNATPGGVWSSSNTAVATVNSSGLVTAVSEGVSTIKYDVTGNSSCSQSAEKPLRVIGLPIVNYVPDQQVCEGTSFNPINFSGTAGATFNWTNSDVKIGLSANGSGNINAFIAKGTIQGGSAFTSYINVTPTIGNCIGNINILKLSVSPRDNASFTYNNDLFCKNQTDPTPVILGTKGGVFSAISNGLVVNSITGTINLSASSPGNNHSVIYKTKGLCSTNYTASFVIQSTPTVDSIPDYTICPGIFADSIKIKGTVGSSFEWTNSNTKTGLTAKGQNIIYPFNAINNGTTNLISEISIIPTLGGCVGPTKKFNISVRVVPRLIISQLDTSVCSGGTFNFKTELTPSSSNSIHQWFVNDLKVSGDSAYYSSNSLKNYDKLTVNVSGKDFCPTTSILFVRVNSLSLSMQLPSMLYVKAPAVNLVGYPNGGTFIGKGIMNNKLDPNIVGVGSKLVTYSFKNAKNCVGQITEKIIIYDTVPNNCHSITYDTITVTNNVTKYDTVKVSDTVSILKVKFKLTTGIKANQETTMRVYPNPTSDILRIEVADEKAMAGYAYKIIDAAGKEVYNQPVKAAVTEIPLKTLGAVGAYFLEVLDENFKIVVSKKIILE